MVNKQSKRGKQIVGIAAAMLGIFLIYGLGWMIMDKYDSAKLTGRMKTVCVGRFLIDLPDTAEFGA